MQNNLLMITQDIYTCTDVQHSGWISNQTIIEHHS